MQDQANCINTMEEIAYPMRAVIKCRSASSVCEPSYLVQVEEKETGGTIIHTQIIFFGRCISREKLHRC